MQRLIGRIGAFARDERASVALEAVVVTPILCWMFVASFVFFDAFRTYAISIKASYAVADVLSRQNDALDSGDIEGLADVFQFLTRETPGTSMRVTHITRQAGGYQIDWSHGTGGQTCMRASDFPGLVERIPIMAFGDGLLIIETRLPHRPAFNVGLRPQVFENFNTTRPRFAGQARFNPTMDNSCHYHTDAVPEGEDGVYVEPGGDDDDDGGDGR